MSYVAGDGSRDLIALNCTCDSEAGELELAKGDKEVSEGVPHRTWSRLLSDPESGVILWRWCSDALLSLPERIPWRCDAETLEVSAWVRDSWMNRRASIRIRRAASILVISRIVAD
jgi:hypothetical protein